VASWGPERAWLAVLALPLLVLAGCGGSADGNGVVTGLSSHESDTMNGAVLDTPYSLADATLTDTDGQPFDIHKQLDKPLTLVFFGYSHCPDICPAVMANLASAVARLDATDASEVQVWFVTTDPGRDSPAVLKTYVGRFDPRFQGLTGSINDILTVAHSVHLTVEKGPKLPGGGYEVTHSTPVLGVRKDGSVPIVWTEGTSPSGLAADITAILHGHGELS
jgi:protein SCO1/2